MAVSINSEIPVSSPIDLIAPAGASSVKSGMGRCFGARILATSAAIFFLGCYGHAAAQDRIPTPIDDTRTSSLAHSVPPQARPEYDRGLADANLSIAYATLFIQPSPAQQKELDQLLADQQDRQSSSFHRWLSPEQFADRFGLSSEDAAKLTAWL